MGNYLENFFNLIDKYHQNRIINFLKLFNLESIIDVGSHKGEFLSYALKLSKIKKIYAFEPQIEINKILAEKFAKHKNIEIFNFALDKEVSKKKIYINKLSSTSTLSELNRSSFYLKLKNFFINSKNNFVNSYYVNTNTIDNLFKDILLRNTLLKVDVEGFEINVLMGGINKIKTEIPFILIEHQMGNQYKNSNARIVHKFLLENNFKVLKTFFFPTLHFKDVLYKKIK
tara:strand:- start:288 stop:974 length:687 start_codon:yes stop_codon:yes gene_type:complete